MAASFPQVAANGLMLSSATHDLLSCAGDSESGCAPECLEFGL